MCNFKSKSLLAVLVFSISTLPVFSQDEVKSEKEKLREEERAYTAAMVKRVLSTKKYVIEANYLAGESGRRIPVPPTLNFILVDSSKITFQIGSNSGGPGFNGVGGSTVEGKITKYLVKERVAKKSQATSYFISIYTITSFGNFDFALNIYDNATADASISDNMGNKLRYYGNLIPPEQSVIFKGVPTR